ncbi:dimethylmenaquinone methyltransferase [Streptomyces sp. CB00455]|uniref:RraA family protein n=1 Tax=Streptomyces sp. CB00455 TaxID=1703927 RepID=UPI00093F6E20|nr:dimethylmenaquinone methyltransferase [Streptomyces sp. CB00455]OKK21801.1 dimethylmenaquinone methyltransferase [Streptomyces sp. CB00455]
MDALKLRLTYQDLTTAHVADALMRLGLPVRQAPPAVRPLRQDAHVVGRARPARHYGSVDVFLEAVQQAAPGDILVVDNAGRQDEACVGDLIALEAERAGLGGIVIWGLHRDSRELRSIGLPVFSQGALPVGPRRLDPQGPDALTAAQFGGPTITGEDFVLGDDDGVLFLPLDRAAEIAETATSIRDIERHQAARMRLGTSLRDQIRFDGYLTARERDGVSFRAHLRSVGGAVEE